MQLSEHVYWIGSGELGMHFTDALDCNIFLLDGGTEKAIIDTGTGYGIEQVLEQIHKYNISPDDIQYILLTHGHMDHVGGAARLQKLTNAKVVTSPATAAMITIADEQAIGLIDGRDVGIYPKDCKLEAIPVHLQVSEGSTFAIGNLSIQVIETPGHSPDSISFYCPELQALFSGDVVFWGGQIAFQQNDTFSLSDLQQSMNKLSRLEVTSLFPGHLAPVMKQGIQPIKQACQAFADNKQPRSIV